jgi:hypothetical protein
MRTKTLTLPESKIKVKIKAITPLAFGKIYGVAAAGDDISTTMRIVCECCLEPRYAGVPEDDKTLGNKISIETLSLTDFVFLSREITTFSGLDKALANLDPTSAPEKETGRSSSTSQQRSSAARRRTGRRVH